MKKCITVFLLIFLFIKISACLNELRVDLKGKAEIGDDMFYVPHGHNLEDKTHYSQQLHNLDSLWKANKKIEDYLDYGVNLVYLGRYKEAEQVFSNAEKLQPGLYTTAANLGTTYELLGENELALQWIKKAVEIDPTSHQGSEWLHIKILEAKINGENYINSDFLISTNFGNGSIPKSELSMEELEKLRTSIFYQLNERVSFVKPKDKIVAILLFDLGNICALMNDVTSALRVYDEAKVYGYSTKLFSERYAKLMEIHKDYDHKNFISSESGVLIMLQSKSSQYILLSITGIVFCGIILSIYFYIKRKKSIK